MNAKLILAAASLCAIGASPLPAQQAAPPATPQTVTLRFQFKPGMSRSYNTAMDVTGTLLTGQTGAGVPIHQHLEMTLRQTVQDVRASDGAATLVTGIEAMKLGAGDQQKTAPPSLLDQMKAMTTIVVTPTGKILSTTFSPMLNQLSGGKMSGGAFNPLGLIETVFTLPVGSVSIGDSWHGSESTTAAASAPTSTYTLKSVGLSGGMPTAVIERVLDGNFNTTMMKAPAPMKIMSRTTGTGETELDTQDGSVLSQEITGNSVITVVTRNLQTGTSLTYKMRTQTKIDMGQIFSAAVPNPAPPAQ